MSNIGLNLDASVGFVGKTYKNKITWTLHFIKEPTVLEATNLLGWGHSKRINDGGVRFANKMQKLTPLNWKKWTKPCKPHDTVPFGVFIGTDKGRSIVHINDAESFIDESDVVERGVDVDDIVNMNERIINEEDIKDYF